MLTSKERLKKKLEKLEEQKKAIKEVVELQKKIEAEKRAIASLKGDVTEARLNKLAALLKKMERATVQIGRRAYTVQRSVESMMVPKAVSRDLKKRKYKRRY